MKYEDAKRLGLKEVGGFTEGKKVKRYEGRAPAKKEVRRPAFRKEVRDRQGTRPKLVPEEAGVGEDYDPDPRKIDVKKFSKQLKKSKEPFFKPEFIQHASYGMGRGGDPTELELGMPTSTTGGEAFVMDEGRTELHHRGATEFNEEYAEAHNAMLRRYGVLKEERGELLRKPRIDLLLTESTMEGQNIDRGKDPDNPVSFEGTKGRGLSRPQKAPPAKVNTLEKTLRKGGYLMENEARSSKVNLAGEQIIKGGYYYADQPRYKYDEKFADLRIKSQASSRGECGDGTKTCSEFYVMVENSAPEDEWNMGEGDYGKSKQKQLQVKQMPQADIDAYQNRPDSKARFRAESNRPDISKPSELDYDQVPDMSKQLLTRDDLRITEYKGKPLSKMKPAELRRLAQTKGIPTTTKTERSGDFAPAKLSKANLIKKLNIGLPRDMDYDFFDTETSTDEVRRVYESGITEDMGEDDLVDLEDETLLEFGNYAQYSNAPDAFRD